VVPASQSVPSRNLTTDPYYTDGYRQVLVFDRHPTSLSDIEILPWEMNTKLNSKSPPGAKQ
jgi:hypothetical protein